jgi:hypothetical protein
MSFRISAAPFRFTVSLVPVVMDPQPHQALIYTVQILQELFLASAASLVCAERVGGRTSASPAAAVGCLLGQECPRVGHFRGSDKLLTFTRSHPRSCT